MVTTLLVLLVTVNWQIANRERIVRSGTTILLRLAPQDPRSLLQGDYMALRYAMTRVVGDAAAAADISDGHGVVELDDAGEARFVELYTGQAVGARQHLLRFRKRGDSVRIASDAFFFEEGHGDRYRGARFGELRVSNDGDAVLTGLRDGAHQALGGPLHP
jgi:uncharacterized membrane-anchored protein